MEIDFSKECIALEKELNALDRFVMDFTEILNKQNIKYVVLSGYVAILFGRNRSSEDIDLILEKMNYDTFSNLWTALSKEFECLITGKAKEAYDLYLCKGYAIRFSRKGKFIPNIEIKFPKIELDDWTIKNRKKVSLNKKLLFISPLELQIPFKLFLGSEKDIEDAKYLYALFKDKLDMSLLSGFNRKLNIEKVFINYLK